MDEPKSSSGLPCAWQAIPILISLFVGSGIMSSAAVDTPVLIVGDKNIKELNAQGDINLDHLEH